MFVREMTVRETSVREKYCLRNDCRGNEGFPKLIWLTMWSTGYNSWPLWFKHLETYRSHVISFVLFVGTWELHASISKIILIIFDTFLIVWKHFWLMAHQLRDNLESFFNCLESREDETNVSKIMGSVWNFDRHNLWLTVNWLAASQSCLETKSARK